MRMQRKDGKKIWADLSGSLMSDAQDESVWVMLDITDSKEAELNRLRLVEVDAEDRQFIETRRLKRAFLNNMSHEMRTPLNSVIGVSGLLETGAVGPDSPKFKAYISHIRKSGQRLLQLTENMLDFADASAGRIEFEPTLVSLLELLDDVVAMLKVDAENKQLEVVIEVDPALGELVLDPMRLKQVVLCYVSNAIKFSTGPSRVTVRARAEPSEHLRIEVEDDGIGIAEADLTKLFKKFRQISEGSTKSYQGTGMGLALSRLLVEAQGGSVGVRSTLGAGSVFWLVLPCRRGPEAQRVRQQ